MLVHSSDLYAYISQKNHFQYCLLPLLVENNEIKENRGINFYFLCNNA